jgi:hypothetical protein
VRRAGIVVVAVATVLAVVGADALAAPPAALCHSRGTDDRLRPLPPSLTGKAIDLFGLSAMPPEQIRRTTVYRCMAGQVMLCTVGANLPCGKANTDRHSAAADGWCGGHPDSDFIPMYVTGHDTIYRWRCAGGRAITVGKPLRVDRRGFIARLWKRVD